MREFSLIGRALAIALVALAATPVYAQTADPSTQTTQTAMPASISIPFAGLSGEITAINGDIDAATARALQLEAEITALDDDNRALESRIDVTAARLLEQQTALDAADARVFEAEERYRARLVQVYKRGSLDTLTLLFTSDTLTELVSRAALLTRIAEDDSRVVADLTVAAADARYQKALLVDLQTQDRALKQAQDDRLDSLSRLLAEQDALVAQLTVEAREALLQARQLNAQTRQQWRSASIPIGTQIPRATATIEGRPGVTYVISGYMPRTYRSTGETFSAVCSWYGPGFNGRGTASGQVFNEDDLTCASKTLPFGTVLALTRGDRRVIVYVNDRGPYIAGRDLDLSKAAAAELGFGGVTTVTAEILTPVQ